MVIAQRNARRLQLRLNKSPHQTKARVITAPEGATWATLAGFCETVAATIEAGKAVGYLRTSQEIYDYETFIEVPKEGNQ